MPGGNGDDERERSTRAGCEDLRGGAGTEKRVRQRGRAEGGVKRNERVARTEGEKGGKNGETRTKGASPG